MFAIAAHFRKIGAAGELMGATMEGIGTLNIAMIEFGAAGSSAADRASAGLAVVGSVLSMVASMQKASSDAKIKAIDSEIAAEQKRDGKSEASVEKIKARNGQVVFLRLPTDDALWDIDEEFFSRKLYWDQFMTWLNTDSIHFKDVPGLDQFDLPDDSHMDQRDSDAFTRILFNYIKKENLLK